MFGRKLLGGAALAALGVALAPPAIAQETTAALRGTVSGESGSPIAGAKVVITHTPTGSAYETTTDSGGTFGSAGLRVGGPYTVSVSAAEYEPQQLEGITLGIADNARVAVALKAGAADAAVVVTATRVTSTRFGPSTRLNVSDIEGVASVKRDIRDIMARDPLVTIDPTNSGAPQIAGANNRLNNFSIDGVNFRDEFGLNASGLPAQRSPISIDALESFTVEVAPYSVENGNFLGGNISAVTKSGSNEFHGSAFYNYSGHDYVSDSIDDRPLNLRPTWELKNWGATLGGPILKDKLFFFGSYEKYESPVPGTDGPEGSSAAVQAIGVSVAELNRIQQIMQSVYGYNPGAPFTGGAESDEKILGKIDWNITDDHRLSVTYNSVETSVPNAGSTQTGTFAITDPFKRLQLDSHWYDRIESVETLVAQVNSNWTDRFSTELRWSKKDYEVAQTSHGGTGFADFDICSVDSGTTLCSTTQGQVLLGPDSSRHANSLSTKTDAWRFKARYTLGAHDLVAGYETSKVDVFNLFKQGTFGEYYFNSIDELAARRADHAFFAGGGADGNGDGVINSLDTAAIFSYRNNTVFAQDSWDLTDKLTIAYGLRYDWVTSDDVPPRNANFVARSTVFSNAAYRNIDNTHGLDGLDLVQPRFGFTYDVTDNIRVHGGTGVFGAIGPGVWAANSFQNNGFTSGSLTANSGSNADLLTGVSINSVPPAALLRMQGTAGATSEVNLMDPNFKIPSIWRSSIGTRVDLDLWNWSPLRLTADFIYTKNYDSAFYQNLRFVPSGAFADGRPNYVIPTTVGGVAFGGSSGRDLLLTNKDGGEGKVFSFTASQAYEKPGIDWTFGYAHQDITEVSPLTSSTANSGYQNIAVFDANAPSVAVSNYETENRLTLQLNWQREFFTGLETRFTLFGEHRSGYPFSYTMTGAAGAGALSTWNASAPGWTGSANTRNLIFVPDFANDANPNDLQVGIVAFNTAATRDALKALVESTDLRDYQGAVAARNAFKGPDVRRVDFHFSQQLPWFIKGHKLSFLTDIVNLGNLVNDEWGTVEKYAFPNAISLVTATPADLGGGQVGYTYSGFTRPTSQICAINTQCSREGFYTIQIGLKYQF